MVMTMIPGCIDVVLFSNLNNGSGGSTERFSFIELTLLINTPNDDDNKDNNEDNNNDNNDNVDTFKIYQF